MGHVIPFLIVVSLVAGISCQETKPNAYADISIRPLSSRMTEFINSINTTWTASHYSKYSEQFLKRLVGVHLGNSTHRLREHHHLEDVVDIPDHFDARLQWPDCPSISRIRDQGSCGSCWAIAATEAMSDRTCIASGGNFTADISAEDLLSCCQHCSYGCRTGLLGAAWIYWVTDGLVTGGSYNSSEGCRPYEIPACDHHAARSPQSHRGQCRAILHTPKCVKMCQPSYNISYVDDKTFGKSFYCIESNSVKQIQLELMHNGPVEAHFTLYADFINYKSGVYQRHSQHPVGGHAIRLLGWGVENGTPYWLCANSWNTDWGDNGYFKILRGKNECGIENYIFGGIPKVESL